MTQLKTHHQSGQITIFYSTTVLVIITFIAFLVNIGIFVKAKINLQNAVDAAAWSGAAVQSRKLTNIAYLNWEMRNVYKEWMFKYYVLGNLSLDSVTNGASGNTNFRMNAIDEAQAKDSYNFPSVCLNFNGSSANSNNINVCRTYSVPGLPRFESTNMFGIDQTTTAFINTMVREKAKACAEMSKLNFLTTNIWAYNVPNQEGNSLQEEAPEIASRRWGAFPNAFDLALRIRNLEYQINLRPKSDGVCMSQDSAAGNCNTSISDLAGQNSVANERVIKAFYAGYRNLGNEDDSELKNSFTLTEISPTPVIAENIYDLSNIFLPSGNTGREKFYLDLKVITLNLATFYTNFTPASSQEINTSLGRTATEGQCDATKTALPVPGYPLGFVKNPDVVTYYAVKGEANFVGLFNPFSLSNGGIKITAYSAAKPFGGRVGPMAASVGTEGSTSLVYPRGNGNNITSLYMVGIDAANGLDRQGERITTDPNTTFTPGAPLPLTTDFWLSDNQSAIGGWTSEGSIRFAIPNIPYEYPDSDITGGGFLSPVNIQLIVPGGSNEVSTGLYNAGSFNKMRDNLAATGALNGTIGPDAIEQALDKVRAPTLFEANNYLIPTPESLNAELKVDSFGLITGNQVNGVYSMGIYAPLYGDNENDYLFKSAGDLQIAFESYIDSQMYAVQKYVEAMSIAASNMRSIRALNNSGPQTNLEAANIISDSNEAGGPTCNSMAGMFAYFYIGDFRAPNIVRSDPQAVCPKSLKELLFSYWSNNANQISNHYPIRFASPPDEVKDKLFTAYRPGPMHGANEQGVFIKSIGAKTPENMWRNFYSTKFISLKSLYSAQHSYAPNTGFTILSEGNSANNEVNDISAKNFTNPLSPTSIGELEVVDY